MIYERLEKIMEFCWKGSQCMALDVKISAGGLVVIWNPKEIVFQGSVESPRFLTGLF